MSFDIAAFLAWVLLSNFVPGALLSVALFRKDGWLNLFEKILIGCAIGFVAQPLIPFLLYFFFGMPFSHGLVLLSVGALYALALAAFMLTRTYEDFLPRELKFRVEPKELLKSLASSSITLVMLLLLALTFLARLGTYSPVFQELDPYFYTYTATQLLTDGYNMPDDATSWYPEVEVNHRIIPSLSYLEASWFALYSGGGAYDNMLLALISSLYPPIAAVLAVFFIYLFVAAVSKREWGLTAAALASFVPVFIYKLTAGEQEVQPYAFFALFFFLAMYAFTVTRKGLRMPTLKDPFPGHDAIFPALAGLAFAALALGSSSQIVAIISLVGFISLQAILVFLRDDDESELRHIILSNSIIFLIGPLFFSAIVKSIFTTGAPSLSIAAAFLAPILLACVLLAIKRFVRDKVAGAAAVGALVLVGFVLFAATPLGAPIKDMGKAGFEIAKYNAPLDRTIAEQGSAATVFAGQMGFIAQNYYFPQSIDGIPALVNLIMFILLIPITMVVNMFLALFVGIANLLLGSDVSFSDKDASLLHLFLFLFWCASAYAAMKFYRKEDDGLFLLVLAVVMPSLVVGLIKAKYTIYSGVLLAVAIGFTFGQMGSIIRDIAKWLKDEEAGKVAYTLPVFVATLVILLQFASQGFAPALIWGSTLPLYQNDPSALAAKFQQMCAASNDADICQAASDPLGYAARGTNYQYSTKLCMLSVYPDYQTFVYAYDGDGTNDMLIPPHVSTVASFRCQRLSDYWVDSMEWLRDNAEPGARVTSWWDYGHWINYFGQRNAVIRNEHVSHKMIGDVAHGYLDATPEELKAWMLAHDSEYALFDIELVSSGGALGGKYGALNYLSCARDNRTSVLNPPGQSECEAEHLWETILVSGEPCTISTLSGKTGLSAYKTYIGGSYSPYYPDSCTAPADSQTQLFCKNYVRLSREYCVGNATLATGGSVFTTYRLNETYPNGDLRLNKAILQLPYNYPSTYHVGQATAATLFYTGDPIWIENGEIKSGYEDRKGRFYDSALYRAMFLNDLPGFELVYQSQSGAVKIYKIAG